MEISNCLHESLEKIASISSERKLCPLCLDYRNRNLLLDIQSLSDRKTELQEEASKLRRRVNTLETLASLLYSDLLEHTET